MKIKYIFGLFIFAVFAACEPKGEKPEAAEIEVPQKINYSALGDSIANATQLALSGKLKMAMKAGGVAEALNYCNLNALPLTDSMATLFGATIKRATNRPRNLANVAKDDEVGVLEVWHTKLENEGVPSPVLFEGEDKVDFYKPIIVQPLCTTCHGEVGKTLTVENQKLIEEKYPNDQAINYQAGDLRGMWHITFTK